MSEYETKPGQGAIFKNKNKNQDTHPDYNGMIKDPTGKEWALSLWVKESQSGTKYFSVSVKEPYVKPTEQPIVVVDDDDLPF